MDIEFKINEFEGPLDLLLHLIKESKMDIMNIEIEKITEQYMAYLDSQEKMNLEIASEYLVLDLYLLTILLILFFLCFIYFYLSIFYLTYPTFCFSYSTVGSLQSVLDFIYCIIHYTLTLFYFF